MICFKKSEDKRKCSDGTWCRVFIALAFLLAVAVPSGAENWVKFLETPIGGKFFIDTDSITFIGNNRVSVWVKQADTTGYVMFQYFIDFSYRTCLDVSTLFYNRDGTLLFEVPPSLRWSPISYDSIPYYAYKFLESWLK